MSLKNYSHFIIFLLCVFSFGLQSAYAQSPTAQPTLVATVNIGHAYIVSQKDRDVSVSFDISNRIGAQAQIKYMVGLSKNGVILDEHVYPDTFSLGENSSVTKKVTYSIPASIIGGTYHLVIESRNNSGVPLAGVDLGEISVKAPTTKGITILSNTCVIKDSATSTKYTLNQTPTLSATSTLTLTCAVTNMFSSEIMAKPVFETRKSSKFGDIISVSGAAADIITLKPGTQNITVVLPKASRAQYYIAFFSLAPVDGSGASNIVTLSYIIPGDMGNIQNVVFDKSLYQVGDTAHVQIYQISQGLGTSTVSLSITNDQGQPCNDQSNTEIPPYNAVSTITTAIIQTCVNPKATIILSVRGTDGNKIILDSKNYSIVTPRESLIKGIPALPPAAATAVSFMSTLLLIIFAVMALGVYVYKRKNNVVLPVMILILGFGLLSFQNIARADTYTIPEIDLDFGSTHTYYYYQFAYSPSIFTYQNMYVMGGVANNMSNSSLYPPQTELDIVPDTVPGLNVVGYGTGPGGGGLPWLTQSKNLDLFTAGTHTISVNTKAWVSTAKSCTGGMLHGTCQAYSCPSPFYGRYGNTAWFGSIPTNSIPNPYYSSGNGCLYFTQIPWNFTATVVAPTVVGTAALNGDNTANISWNLTHVDYGTVTMNGNTTPYIGPHYDTVITTTPAVYGWVTSLIDGSQTWQVIQATTTTQSQVYVPATSGATTSPALISGDNTFTFNGYVNGITNPVVTQTQTVHVAGCALGSGQILVGGYCTCPSGGTLVNGSCVPPPAPSLPSGNGGSSGTTISALCTPIQTGSSKIILNTAMSWNLALPNTIPTLTGTSTAWSGTDIKSATTNDLSLPNIIYTTINNPKWIYATTTGTGIVDGNPYMITCSASTTVYSGTGSFQER